MRDCMKNYSRTLTLARPLKWLSNPLCAGTGTYRVMQFRILCQIMSITIRYFSVLWSDASLNFSYLYSEWLNCWTLNRYLSGIATRVFVHIHHAIHKLFEYLYILIITFTNIIFTIVIITEVCMFSRIVWVEVYFCIKNMELSMTNSLCS